VDKNGLGTILGHFFKNSFGHPATQSRKIWMAQKKFNGPVALMVSAYFENDDHMLSLSEKHFSSLNCTKMMCDNVR
jgi:hypothetical protein